MLSLMMACGLLMAQEPTTPHLAPAAPLVVDATSSLEDPGFTAVKKKKRSGGGSSRPLAGTLGWVLAGLAGAVVPLLLFALPAVVFAWWWGPGTPFWFMVSVFWGTLVVAAGSALTWVLLASLSAKRSGWLIPVAVGAAVGGSITAVGAIVAAMLVWMGWASWWFFSFAFPLPGYLGWGSLAPFYALAFAVWACAVVGASIGGPLLAAYLYDRLGVSRGGDNNIHWADVMTPN